MRTKFNRFLAQHARRRGNVIVLAVAVLAIMAVSAASYVTITRLDRASSIAYEKRSSISGQRRAVMRHIQSLLAADLFGNKIVTNSVPRQTVSGEPVWPNMFEDGEYYDYPHVRLRDENGQLLVNFKKLPIRPQLSDSFVLDAADPRPELRIAFPDDGWLASTEPTNELALDLIGTGSPFTDGLWDAWPQITNLRTAYTWDNRQTAKFWVRGDGQYVDLANFFLSQNSTNFRRGDPGADLTNLSMDPTYGGTAFNLAFDPFAEPGPEFGLRQPVYHMQMNAMQEFIEGSGTLNPDVFSPVDLPYELVDTRMWADADGDGRPDSRWQELDSLGSALGLRWVVAARIVDSSASVNVNSSIELGIGENWRTLGYGVTPADIDLYRLLDSSMYSQNALFPAHPDLAGANQLPGGARVNPGFNESIMRGLSLGLYPGQPYVPNGNNYVLDEITNRIALGLDEDPIVDWNDALIWRDAPNHIGWDASQRGEGFFSPNTSEVWDSRLELTREAREAYYRFVGIDPSSTQITTATNYPVSDEIDLRAFWGFNYPTAISKIEQRLDGPETNPQYNRLPGQTTKWPEQRSVGIMRSAEEPEDARTFNDQAGFPSTNGSTNPYLQKDKVERIERDLRRLLTTYSGTSISSPVSPKNTDSRAGGQYSLPKIMGGDLAPDVDLKSPVPIESAIYEREMSRYLTRATGAFFWALAPFGGDRPVMRGAPYNVFESAHHYGGRNLVGDFLPGPAAQIGADLGGDMGVSYALIRAASLAVNLVDAEDDEETNAGNLMETPTIARVHKSYDVDLLKTGAPAGFLRMQGVPQIEDDLNIVEIGVEFAHADIGVGPTFEPANPLSPDMLPEQYMGTPQEGITLVGLDRQPFLVEATSFVAYEGSRQVSEMQANPSWQQLFPIDPGDGTTRGDQIGSIIAIEIGNPWPAHTASTGQGIDVSNYRIILTDGPSGNSIEFDLGDVLDSDDFSLIDTPGAPGSGQPDYVTPIIPAGMTAVFWIAYGDASNPAWVDARDEYLDDIRGSLADATLMYMINPGLDSDTGGGSAVRINGNDFDADDTGSYAPVFFGDFGTNRASVLLVHADPTSPNITQQRALVDRMAPGTSATDPFPVPFRDPAIIILNAANSYILGTEDPLDDFIVRFSAESSFRRPDAIPTPPGAGTPRGFPSYVVERADTNTTTLRLPIDDDLDETLQVFLLSEAGTIDDTLLANDPVWDFGQATNAPLDIPLFQLFVPNSPLVTPAEILRLCELTHLYRGDATGFRSETSIDYVRDYQITGNSAMWPDAPSSSDSRWRTIGEQLGADEYRNYDAFSGGGGFLNRHLGSIDIARYVPGDQMDEATGSGSGTTWNEMPEQLRVPLGVRVVDAFETLGGTKQLVQGRVNINTAPERVLRVLPYVDPKESRAWYNSAVTTNQIPEWTSPQPNSFNADHRIESILQYRASYYSDLMGTMQRFTPTILTQIPKLRLPTNEDAATYEPNAFVSLGELAILGKWNSDQSGTPLAVANESGFLELAIDNVNQGENPLAINQTSLDFRHSALEFGNPTETYDGIDDTEERLALFNAISNVVSTRSDVFTAWFIVRAYDPRVIEAVEVDPSQPDNRRAELLNELAPTFEQRWLVVFDRSNVKKPTDRPRVVLSVQLPSTSP